MSLNIKNKVFLLIIAHSIIMQDGFADGYRNSPEGAAAIGAFGGHRAFADDANATIHNSANLVDLKQPMIQINTTLGYGRTKYSNGGASDQSENPYFAIPGFSVAAPLKEGKYAVGFATYIPFGRSVDWGKNDFFANNNASYSGSMTVMDFTPNFSMRLTDSLSIGIGADIYYGEVEQKTKFTGIPAFFLGLSPGTVSKLTADGTALGWNAAVTWNMTERQRLSATYRSPFTIKYEGENELSSGGQSDVNAKIEYPDIVALAYGIELTDSLRAEVDAEWLNFSQYETLTLNDTDPRFAGSVAQKLKDTWTIGIGGAWDFAANWTARSGFMYLKNPTPDETYNPLGPDEDQGVISFGLSYENEKSVVDIGYAYGLFGGRAVSGNIINPAHNGNYDYNVHLLSLSYGYKF
jgi:long-chain fatty acid transport protein